MWLLIYSLPSTLHIIAHTSYKLYCGFGSFLIVRYTGMEKLTSYEHDWESFSSRFFFCLLSSAPHLHCHRSIVEDVVMSCVYKFFLLLFFLGDFSVANFFLSLPFFGRLYKLKQERVRESIWLLGVKRKKCSLKLRNFPITISIGFFIDEEIHEFLQLSFHFFFSGECKYAQRFAYLIFSSFSSSGLVGNRNPLVVIHF